ncbi:MULTISPECIES: hypothetical protein [Qipengyuania]|uniref:Uncharacterized protein n=2 Tax=Qipengyuania TaxID=1855416 RepID=A0A9Q3XD89_9SPHN|nr:MULTISPECIES: hypothetical protein [Qipengyuania]MBY6217511.1 hypothetical protein [Qipengyuania aquimaris]QZD92540.1 hypothetical protein K3162_00360 [Qipengyuania xiapuensis]
MAVATKLAEAPSMVHGCYDCGLLDGTPARDSLVDFMLVAPVLIFAAFIAFRAFQLLREKLNANRRRSQDGFE